MQDDVTALICFVPGETFNQKELMHFSQVAGIVGCVRNFIPVRWILTFFATPTQITDKTRHKVWSDLVRFTEKPIKRRNSSSAKPKREGYLRQLKKNIFGMINVF